MSAADASSDTPNPARGVKLAGQFALFAVGIALFAWVLARAHGELTPERIDDLRAAGPVLVFALAALTAASFALNGLGWWVALSPVRRLPLLPTVGVNVAATALAYLPGKLSVVFRVLYHKRTDRVPVMQFGGWAAAFTAITIAGLGPGIAASIVYRGDTGPGWWAIAIGGAIVTTAAIVALARLFDAGPGWRWLERTARRLPGGPRLVGSAPFAHAHTGLRMLAAPRATAAGVAIRFADALGYAARFLIVGAVLTEGDHLGGGITLGEAMVAGVGFFLISALAPTGPLGLREAATGGLLGVLVTDGLRLVVVTVSLVELLTAAICGPLAALFLKRAAGVLRGVTEELRGSVAVEAELLATNANSSVGGNQPDRNHTGPPQDGQHPATPTDQPAAKPATEPGSGDH